MSELISLNVTGMKCGGCENNAKIKLEAIQGVINVEARHKDNKIKIEFNLEKTSKESIIEVIIQAGYKVG